MKRKSIADTLYGLRMSLTTEDKKIQLLLGIYELMIAIADRLDVFEEDEGGGSESLGDGRQNPIAPKGTREK